MTRAAVRFAAVFLVKAALAAQEDPCAAASSVSDVRFTLALKNGRAVFESGETIPLVLSFTSTAKNRYWADVRNYDRSGRLGTEAYCVTPEAPDPLESYFKVGAFFGGGLGTMQQLGAAPFTAEAELNEWRRLGPGHYRVYAMSYRVWRPPDPNENTPYGRVSVVLRSNPVEFEVKPPNPTWQSSQLKVAIHTLDGAASPDDARRAARVLRFLSTEESTRQLARLFSGLNQRQPADWDLMFGLYGSPYPKLAIDSLHQQLAAPDHAVTSDFLNTLENLQIINDPAWDQPPEAGKDPEIAQKFWERRRAHTEELEKAEMAKVAAAVEHKSGRARALTLNGLLLTGLLDPGMAQRIRPALIAAWNDLPPEAQRDLIQYRWPLIAGPEMLPILRRVVAEPPPSARTEIAMTRDAALKHIYEIDRGLGRELILRDALDPNAQASLGVIQLLPKEDIALVLAPAVERIEQNDARDLDYELLDHYADGGALQAVQTVFAQHLGKFACAPQTAMLRYFLRVDSAYGAKQVSASLKARIDTHCYSNLLQSLGSEFPKVQQSAIEALDDPDPELVQDAVLALGRWGSADAEGALWARLRRFHTEWTGHQDQLRVTPNYRDSGSRAAALEQALMSAIAGGSSWLCPLEKLARLRELVLTQGDILQIENWIKEWNQGPPVINPNWFPEENRTFSVLQYISLTEDQLVAKLAQFPRGTELRWQFWPPGQISPPVSMAVQTEFYERMQLEAEKSGVKLGKMPADRK